MVPRRRRAMGRTTDQGTERTPHAAGLRDRKAARRMTKGPEVWVILDSKEAEFLKTGGSIATTAETGQYVRISYFPNGAGEQQTMDVELPDE